MSYQLTQVQQEYIARIDGRIAQRTAFANYWIGMATSGAAARRTVHRGDGTKLTPDELVDEAMTTALSHIESIEELTEAKCKVIAGSW